MGHPKETKFYDLLGIPPDAKEDDIKRAYKKAAIKYHPDKNPGNADAADKFKEVSAAYEVLSDPDKRQTYDNYGEEGLKGGGFSGSNAEDIFSHFFGGGLFGGGRRQQQGPKRAEDTVFKLKVPLKDLYNGKTKKLKISHNVICTDCKGRGTTEEGKDITCDQCKGKGIKVTMRQIGPGMIQQMQSQCPGCNGSGEVIDPKCRCTGCKGKKLVEKKDVIEVNVDKGMKEGDRLTFYEKGEQIPGALPGDLVVVLIEEKDENFTRKGIDLYYEQKITLSEALTGYQFQIIHLDGRVLVVKSSPTEIIKPDDIRFIEDEGMPVHKSPYEKGKLFIKFSVEFPTPEQLSLPNRKLLEALLPPKPTGLKPPPDAEEVTPKEFSPMEYEQQQHRHEEEEDERQPRSAQCVHQ